MMRSYQQYAKDWVHRKWSRTFQFTKNVKRKVVQTKETEIRSICCKGHSNVNSKDDAIVLEQLEQKEIGPPSQNISRQLQIIFNRFDQIEANFHVMELKIQDIAKGKNALA